MFGDFGKTDTERRKKYQDMVIGDIYDFDAKTIAQGPRNFIYSANRKNKYHKIHKKASYRKNRA